MELPEFLERIGKIGYIDRNFKKGLFTFHCKCGETLAMELPERAIAEVLIWEKALLERPQGENKT